MIERQETYTQATYSDACKRLFSSLFSDEILILFEILDSTKRYILMANIIYP